MMSILWLHVIITLKKQASYQFQENCLNSKSDKQKQLNCFSSKSDKQKLTNFQNCFYSESDYFKTSTTVVSLFQTNFVACKYQQADIV